ncbi:xanthine dehydrogenase family protein molybdopterin-binding subunit [Kordiimonas pumila]|uniref:Molybdopterin cofactor-binding domain-containing protein n=1 Tax=Kordiimonas pumila TaxID=2161677 RepID=A0ABV7D7Q6_9PROT|nr:molybdopterin cofactor-binding domain-containing protein [Kordiimonas pumila]
MNTSISNVSRRDVVKGLGVGTGLVLALPLVSKNLFAAMKGHPREFGSAYLTIGLDGTVHIYIHRVEMGQGSRTGLPQVIADELEADWDRLVFEAAYGDKKFGDQNTDGSTSIRMFYDTFRRAGAAARLMLEQAAAAKWGVALGDVTAQKHRIINNLTGQSEDFSVFVDAASKLPVPDSSKVTLKAPKDHAYIGKPKRNIYMNDFVTGSSVFGQDVKRDNMLFAVAARPPVVGGKLKAYNRDAAMAIKGVVDVVELPSLEFPAMFKPLGGVAVVATNTWSAIKGRTALAATFEGGPNAGYDSVEYEKTLWQAIDGVGTTHLQRGDAEDVIASSKKVYQADYYVPHLSHAPMEPPAATAEWQGENLSMWVCCQDPQSVQETVAPFFNKKPEEIYVEATLLGGAFGRKSKPDFAVEAAVLAKKAGRPVKMVWTREDDIQHGYYHTVSAQRAEAAVGADGKVTAWKHKAAYPPILSTFKEGASGPQGNELGMGLIDMPFEIPNLQVDSGAAEAHVRIGWLRSVCNIQQAFAVGSFVDEIAQGEGQNTADLWLEMIGSDRHVNPADDGAEFHNYHMSLDEMPYDTARLKSVLRKAVEMSGYGKDMPKGKGIGISVHRSFVTYVACAVEVEVLENGTIKVPKAWIAVDCGTAVNPDRVKAQMEGAVLFGMSIALHSEITAEAGQIMQSNFDSYQVCRMSESPDVDVYIMESNAAPGGVGEPGVPPVAPALTNAIFAATGKRIRRLPIKDQLMA